MQEPTQHKKDHSLSGLKIAIIVLSCVCVVVLGVLAFLVFSSSKGGTDSDNNADSSADTQVASTNTDKNRQQNQNAQQDSQQAKKQAADAAYAKLNVTQDFRTSLAHGQKGSQYQKYIVLHDTEGDGPASNVVNYWDSNGKGVGAQFVINKDGSIVQCVAMDQIAHHAGFGNTGHNNSFNVPEDGRDDKRGTQSIGNWASDYGMNSWSVGIEMVHVGGSGTYPEAQLNALDNLIAYIDAYYSDAPGGNGGQIIDHKMWRTGNSDTSAEFAGYLKNYQNTRKH